MKPVSACFGGCGGTPPHTRRGACRQARSASAQGVTGAPKGAARGTRRARLARAAQRAQEGARAPSWGLGAQGSLEPRRGRQDARERGRGAPVGQARSVGAQRSPWARERPTIDRGGQAPTGARSDALGDVPSGCENGRQAERSGGVQRGVPPLLAWVAIGDSYNTLELTSC